MRRTLNFVDDCLSALRVNIDHVKRAPILHKAPHKTFDFRSLVDDASLQAHQGQLIDVSVDASKDLCLWREVVNTRESVLVHNLVEGCSTTSTANVAIA